MKGLCEGGLSQILAFSSKVGTIERHNFLNRLYLKCAQRPFLLVNNDFFIIIVKVACFFLLSSLHEKEVARYSYCPVGLS